MKNILERLAETVLVFDGAMGTMIYGAGVFINTCYDELSLTNPKLIRDIHRQYAQAGADVITTNTFGANPIKLRQYGLAEKTADINRAAAALAREQAGQDVYVAGSVGPCTAPGQLLPVERAAEAEAAYSEQIQALAAGGVNLIVLETFCDIRELSLAARIARRCGLPVAASFAVNDQAETAVGTSAGDMARQLQADPNVDAIGLNCGCGPAGVYDALLQVLPAASKPVIAMPNAGSPRMVGGRMMYLTSPEYFTEYAKKFIELGVRGVGGCCGTTPEHVRVASKAVKTLSGVKKHVEIQRREAPAGQVRVVPAAKKSRFAARLLAGQNVTSVELLPPRSVDLTGLLEKARWCASAGVDAINIPDGPRASARVSPMVAALSIERECGVETVLHYCCRDRNLIGMQSDLLGAYAAGLRNVLIITGDPPKLGDYPDATGVFDVDSIGLTRVTANLNRGFDVGGNVVDPPTGIFIGVGANPCAVDPGREMERYLRKIEAGAEFAITQPIFDADGLLRFLDAAAKAGASVPVIAGIWPLLSFKNAEFMNNEVPGVVVPADTLERMARCQTKEDARRTGVDIARETIARLAGRIRGIQVSAPLGNVEVALAVLKGAGGVR